MLHGVLNIRSHVGMMSIDSMCVAAAHRYFSRAEMGMLGLHFPPLAGIDRTAATKELPAGCPPVSHLPETCSLEVLQATCPLSQGRCM